MADFGPYRDIQSQVIPISQFEDGGSLVAEMDYWVRACRYSMELPQGQWSFHVTFQALLWRSVDSGKMNIGIRERDWGQDVLYSGARWMGPVLPQGGYNRPYPLTNPRYMAYSTRNMVVEGGGKFILEGVMIQSGTSGALLIGQQNLIGFAVRIG